MSGILHRLGSSLPTPPPRYVKHFQNLALLSRNELMFSLFSSESQSFGYDLSNCHGTVSQVAFQCGNDALLQTCEHFGQTLSLNYRCQHCRREIRHRWRGFAVVRFQSSRKFRGWRATEASCQSKTLKRNGSFELQIWYSLVTGYVFVILLPS